MVIDYLEIGAVPANEDCQQVGTPAYDATKARAECVAYINQLRRQFGPEPEGAYLRIKSSPHDFGSYYEVVCNYDPNQEAAISYAYQCEGSATENWDEAAMAELELGIFAPIKAA
jgi:hypothetical protein